MESGQGLFDSNEILNDDQDPDILLIRKFHFIPWVGCYGDW